MGTLRNWLGKAVNWMGSTANAARSRGEKLWSKLLGIGSLSYPGSWASDRTIQVQQFTGWNYVAIMAIADEVASQRPKAAIRHKKEDVLEGRTKGLRMLNIMEKRKAFLYGPANDEELEHCDFDHPLLRLLHNPNAPDTAETFWIRTAMYMRLCGGCYWWVIDSDLDGPNGTKLPKELWVLPPQWVWPKYGGEGGQLIEYYEIRPYGLGMGGHAALRLPTDNVIAFGYPSPIHPFDFQSPIQATAPWTDCAKSIDVSRFAQFKNNGWPGMVVELNKEFADPDETELDAFRAKLAAVYAGERNAGKVLLVPNECKVTPQTRTPLEQDYVQSFDQLRDTTLAVHRVGKSIAGITEDVNKASMAGARANFMYSTVRPMLMLIDGVITEKLASRYDKRLIVFHDDKTPDDPTQKLSEWNAAYTNGCVTPNEYRKNILGLEPFEYGGDDPVLGMTSSVIPWGTGSDGVDLYDVPAATAVRYEGADVGGTTADGGKGGARGGPQTRGAGDGSATDKTAQNFKKPDEKPATPPGQPPIEQTPERAELLSTVGGISGCIDILGKVADGTLGRQSAKQLLLLFFGIASQEAESLLADTVKKEDDAGTNSLAKRLIASNGNGNGHAGNGKAKSVKGNLPSAGRREQVAKAFAMTEKALALAEKKPEPVSVVPAVDLPVVRKFASTQFNIDDKTALAKLEAMALLVPYGDLASDGREKEFHITVKYGLHTDRADELALAVHDFGPVTVRLGKTSIFPANEASAQRGGEQHDVLKVDVDSDSLRRLNQLISDKMAHTDTRPDYKPHVTLAYITAGQGHKYVGNAAVEGLELTFDRLIFSARDDSRATLSLDAGPDHLGQAVAKAELLGVPTELAGADAAAFRGDDVDLLTHVNGLPGSFAEQIVAVRKSLMAGKATADELRAFDADALRSVPMITKAGLEYMAAYHRLQEARRHIPDEEELPSVAPPDETREIEYDARGLIAKTIIKSNGVAKISIPERDSTGRVIRIAVHHEKTGA